MGFYWSQTNEIQQLLLQELVGVTKTACYRTGKSLSPSHINQTNTLANTTLKITVFSELEGSLGLVIECLPRVWKIVSSNPG